MLLCGQLWHEWSSAHFDRSLHSIGLNWRERKVCWGQNQKQADSLEPFRRTLDHWSTFCPSCCKDQNHTPKLSILFWNGLLISYFKNNDQQLTFVSDDQWGWMHKTAGLMCTVASLLFLLAWWHEHASLLSSMLQVSYDSWQFCVTVVFHKTPFPNFIYKISAVSESWFRNPACVFFLMLCATMLLVGMIVCFVVSIIVVLVLLRSAASPDELGHSRNLLCC